MTLLGIWCHAVVVAMVVVAVSNPDGVEAADAIYAFGDSYLDTGNYVNRIIVPYGSSWPGFPDGRWSDGRNQADYFAELFELPTPTPVLHLSNESPPQQGVNFARSGAGVTYVFGVTPLDSQVDDMEALVETGVLARDRLPKSVAVINIGINDYIARNLQTPFGESVMTTELTTFVTTVVDAIALAIVRLHGLGVRHVVVSNIPPMACTPRVTMQLAFTACSTNSTIVNETSLHNSLLQKRVRGLNQQLRGVHVVIVDQTKALEHLFQHGTDYGFVNPLTPCCHGNEPSNIYDLVCGDTDSEGRPIYTECKDPAKAVLFDTIHPTDAAWKAVINLYASVSGFTVEGPKLNTWIRKYNV